MKTIERQTNFGITYAEAIEELKSYFHELDKEPIATGLYDPCDKDKEVESAIIIHRDNFVMLYINEDYCGERCYVGECVEADNIVLRVDARKRIGLRIYEIRKAKNITQEELAEKSGISRVNISKIENGKYNVSIDLLNKICEPLGAKLDIVTL